MLTVWTVKALSVTCCDTHVKSEIFYNSLVVVMAVWVPRGTVETFLVL